MRSSLLLAKLKEPTFVAGARAGWEERSPALALKIGAGG
jgi:hypothetical protein